MSHRTSNHQHYRRLRSSKSKYRNRPKFSGSVLRKHLSTEALEQRILLADDIFDSKIPDAFKDQSATELIHTFESLADALGGIVANTELLGTPIPLLEQSLNDLLLEDPEPRLFAPDAISFLTEPVVEGNFKKFTVHFRDANLLLSERGVQLGDTVRYLTRSGDKFEGAVDSFEAGKVTIRYSSERTDSPAFKPTLSFQAGGSLGDIFRSPLGNFLDAEFVAAQGTTLLGFLKDVQGPLGIAAESVEYADSKLYFTVVVEPQPFEFSQRLDFGDSVQHLSFNATGDFIVQVAPKIQLPLAVQLSSSALPKLSINDARANAPEFREITIGLNATLDDPYARANWIPKWNAYRRWKQRWHRHYRRFHSGL